MLAVISEYLNPYVATLIISMLPIVELRGAIPVAITVYNIEPVLAFILSVLGNIVPGIAIVYLLGPISVVLAKRSRLADRFFSWLFSRTRSQFIKKYETWGALALVIFVAIPLPITGVWTGSVAAFLFNIPKNKSILLLSFGAAISGIIVTLLTLGILSFT